MRIDRPDIKKLRYENLSDQFRLRHKRRPQEWRNKKKRSQIDCSNVSNRQVCGPDRGKLHTRLSVLSVEAEVFCCFEIHESRLEIMRPLIVEEARRKFGPDLVIKSLGELVLQEEDEERKKVLVLGILRKHHVMKPSLLEEQELELNVDFEPRHNRYLTEPDSLSLEDQNTRLELDGFCLDPGSLVSGLALGCWGSWGEGQFWVEELVYSRVFGGSTEGEAGAGTEGKKGRPVSLCVISGLELAGQDAGWLGSAQLAAAWLAGCAGSPGEQDQLADTERLIVAGNSLGRSDTIYEEPERAKYASLPSTDRALAGIRQLDSLLLEVVATLTTDLMPGPSDPSPVCMPQQPLPKGSLKLSSQFPSLRTRTNPYTCSLAGRIITTVAGQTIKDIMRNSRIKVGG